MLSHAGSGHSISKMGKAYSVPKVASKWYDEEVKSLPSLEGKIIAITGCTSGMGLVCARTCAQKGASIILLNRPSDRAGALPHSIPLGYHCH